MSSCNRRGFFERSASGLAGLAAACAVHPETVFAKDDALRDCALIYGTPEYAAAMAKVKGPLVLRAGPHLFLDERLIEHAENLERKVASPSRDAAIGNPLITGKEDRCFQPFFTVSRAPETGMFRIWYGAWPESGSNQTSRIAYLESEDGIHWKRPTRILKDPGPIQFGSEVLDEGPNAADPARRYVYIWWHDGGTHIATSPDGFQFTPISPKAVITHNHDITNIWRDPIRNRYVATISMHLQLEHMNELRRTTFQATSNDLLHWSHEWMVLASDARYDKDVLQFYAMNGYAARGDLVVGMVKNLHDDWKAEGCPKDAYGIGSTSLAWTHDGQTWIRDREVFFGPDPKPGAWDHAHTWIDEQVAMGDEVYLYYGGYRWGHKENRRENRQIGMVKMRRDRYVAREAGEQRATLVTPPATIAGTAVTVNAQVAGELKLRLVDAAKRPLPGFDWVEIHGDALNHAVRFQGNAASLGKQPVRLEFQLQQAKLFGFDVIA